MCGSVDFCVFPGSFFHEDDSDVERTLRCAIRINNHALDQQYRYKTEAQVISKTDTFANGKQSEYFFF